MITEPEPRLSAAGEAEYLTLLMQGGAVSDVHLRYPGNEVRTLRVAEKFPAEMRERLHLHYFPEPAGRLGCGVHLKAGEKPGNVRATRSCHSLEEVRMYPEAEYLFLSPIFDSISKQGYCSQFPARGLLGGVPGNTVALGGVTPRHFLQLMRLGFRGAAMLGWVWSGAGREEAQRKREVIRRFRNAWAGFRLQFITNAPTAGQTAAQAVQAIKGGCRWVQIRMKEAGEEEIRRAVELTAPEARKAGSILLIDDHVELAAEMEEIDGVHLGHSDMPRSEARKILGEEK